MKIYIKTVIPVTIILLLTLAILVLETDKFMVIGSEKMDMPKYSVAILSEPDDIQKGDLVLYKYYLTGEKEYTVCEKVTKTGKYSVTAGKDVKYENIDAKITGYIPGSNIPVWLLVTTPGEIITLLYFLSIIACIIYRRRKCE